MPPRIRWPRHRATILAVAGLAIVIALPVLAASPSPSTGPAASGRGSEPKESHGPKGSKAPEVQVTITGQVGKTTDAKGRPEFTLTAGGKTLHLDAGPPWFYTATNNPLLPFVGKTVTVVGEQSGDEIDVASVNGTAIRAPGKPPWAGGWKRVGKSHPGWSQEKADRWAVRVKVRANGGCWPPGLCKSPEPSGG